MEHMNNSLLVSTWLALLSLLVGCTVGVSEPEPASRPIPTPTMFTYLEPEDAPNTTTGIINSTPVAPTVASLFNIAATLTPRSSSTPYPTLPPYRPVIRQETGVTEFIFDDDLSSGWEILGDAETLIDVSSDLRVYEGERSIAFTPDADFTRLFFTLEEGTEKSYRAEDVIGVSFWLNGGDDFIGLDQLAVAVIGSNDYAYWNPDDDSVEFPSGEWFSETRLYFLGFNDAIPPETWVEVFLRLDTLIYDPLYKYVVGFYLKNDAGYENTLYIDNVSLLLLEETDELVQDSDTNPSSAAETSTSESEQSSGALGGEIQHSAPSDDEGLSLDATTEIEPDAEATPSPTNADDSECIVSTTVPPVEGWELYILQADDVLFNLAVERGVSIEFALSQNCLEVTDIFDIGQQIWLPPPP